MAIHARWLVVSTLGSSVALAQPAPAAPPPASATPPAASTAPPTPAPPAPAPAAPAPPPPGYAYTSAYAVPVDIVGTEPGLRFTISDKDSRPIAECPGNCRLLLLPGRYKIFVHETEDTLSGSRMVDITGPSTVRVDPDTTEHRSAGLGMGIAGPIVMLLGLIAVIASSCEGGCGHQNQENAGRDDGPSSLAVLTLIGGITITPIGWVMYGTSFKPEVDVTTGPAGAAGPAQRKLGRNAFLGARFAF